jgi:DNA invertase Pin-like site-specific DNA recombinase
LKAEIERQTPSERMKEIIATKRAQGEPLAYNPNLAAARGQGGTASPRRRTRRQNRTIYRQNHRRWRGQLSPDRRDARSAEHSPAFGQDRALVCLNGQKGYGTA